MAGMGPPPKDHSARPRDHARRHGDKVRLPSRGRRGRTPAWPLASVETAEQASLWKQLWRTPQAVVWDEFEWTRVVARYVAVVLKAEDELDSKLLAEARQLEDRLGLSPMAMLRLRWTIDGAPEDRPVAPVVDLVRDPRARLRRQASGGA